MYAYYICLRIMRLVSLFFNVHEMVLFNTLIIKPSILKIYIANVLNNQGAFKKHFLMYCCRFLMAKPSIRKSKAIVFFKNIHYFFFASGYIMK